MDRPEDGRGGGAHEAVQGLGAENVGVGVAERPQEQTVDDLGQLEED